MTAGVAVVLALTVGVVMALFGLQRARSEAVRATAAAAAMQRKLTTQQVVTRFLGDMLSVAYPDRDGRKVTLVETLESAAGRLDATTLRQPHIAARIANMLSVCYRSLGLSDLSLAEGKRALAIATEHLPTSHPSLWSAKANIAVHLAAQGKLADAEKMQREVLAGRIAALGADSIEAAESRVEIAEFFRLRNDHAAALRELRAAREVFLAKLGANDRRSIICDNAIAVCAGATDPQGAVAIAQEVFERAEAALGPNHPTTLDAGNTVGTILFAAGRFDEANTVMRTVIDRYEATLGPDHPATRRRLGNLAAVLVRLEQFPAAERVIRRCLTGKRAGLQAMVDRNTLAVVLARQGKFDETRRVFVALNDEAAKTLPAGHWLIGQFRKCYGDCLHATADHAGAERELEAGLAILEQSFAASHERVRRARTALLEVYDALGEKVKADRLRAVIAATDPR